METFFYFFALIDWCILQNIIQHKGQVTFQVLYSIVLVLSPKITRFALCGVFINLFIFMRAIFWASQPMPAFLAIKLNTKASRKRFKRVFWRFWASLGGSVMKVSTSAKDTHLSETGRRKICFGCFWGWGWRSLIGHPVLAEWGDNASSG